MDQEFNLTADNKEATSYRVLARKYRPQTFEDLIGQDPMIKVLAAAFQTGRVAHAYMLTGVRGVGKTTTARLLARAFNYTDTAGESRPTIKLDPPGANCEAILHGNHMDVLEMDAASRTGIDDIREIIESAQFKPAIAPYKVFIVDEVHMLSKAAFNGLLKILEEPPPHVKFIFATTEIRKVPVTILSRCQRFDLRRVEPSVMIEHLKGVCAAEDVKVEDGAVALISRASEGSVRDALSLLDQAIAQGDASKSEVTEELVRDMLGLADRERVLDLLDYLFGGETAAALKEVREQHDLGADPLEILRDLLDLTNWMTRAKVVGSEADDAGISQSQAERGRGMAEKISIGTLSTAWQILLKGVDECVNAPRPVAALEMVLIRFAHSASLPSPEELVKKLQTGKAGAGGRAPSNVPSGNGNNQRDAAPPPSQAAPDLQPLEPEHTSLQPDPAESTGDARAQSFTSFEDIAATLRREKDFRLLNDVETYLHFVALDGSRLEIRLADGAPPDLGRRLTHKLNFLTGDDWVVAVSREAGAATLRDQERAEAERLRSHFKAHPIVEEALRSFPDAEIVSIRELELRDVSDDQNEDPPTSKLRVPR